MTKMMRSVPFGVGAVDWQARIDVARMRQERLTKFQKEMKKHGLAAALLNRPDCIRYTTSIRGIPFPALNYALVFAEHDPIVYLMGETMQQNKVNCPWIKPENWRYSHTWWAGTIGHDASVETAKKFADAMNKDLKDKGLDKEKLGFDMIDEFGRNALSEAGIELTTVMPAMVAARLTKTEDEINCMRTACIIDDIGYYAVFEALKPGITEDQLGAVALAALRRAGSDLPNVGVTSGPRCFEMGHIGNSDRVIEFGDTVYVQFCETSYIGYKSCVYRSFIVGRKPNDKEKDWNKKCYERIHSVIAEIKPGATTADAAKRFLPASTWGYEADWQLTAGELGHGSGLVVHEQPVIHRAWSIDYPQPFEKGMILAVECREGEPFVGGVRLEEMVVVTDNGAELITKWPCEELLAANPIM